MLMFQPAIANSQPSTEQVQTLQFGSSKTWDYLFIKFVGDPVDFTIDGISFGFSPLATHTDVYGNQLLAKSDGFHNEHIDLVGQSLTAQTGTSMTIRFGAAVSVQQILVLNKVLDYTAREWNQRVNYDDIEEIPLGVNKRTATGRLRYVPPLNDEPDKWRIPCDILFGRQHESEFNAFTAFRKTYRGGFVFAVDPVFYPHIIGPALFEGNRRLEYPARWKRAGRRVRFVVRET